MGKYRVTTDQGVYEITTEEPTHGVSGQWDPLENYPKVLRPVVDFLSPHPGEGVLRNLPSSVLNLARFMSASSGAPFEYSTPDFRHPSQAFSEDPATTIGMPVSALATAARAAGPAIKTVYQATKNAPLSTAGALVGQAVGAPLGYILKGIPGMVEGGSTGAAIGGTAPKLIEGAKAIPGAIREIRVPIQVPPRAPRPPLWQGIEPTTQAVPEFQPIAGQLPSGRPAPLQGPQPAPPAPRPPLWKTAGIETPAPAAMPEFNPIQGTLPSGRSPKSFFNQPPEATTNPTPTAPKIQPIGETPVPATASTFKHSAQYTDLLRQFHANVPKGTSLRDISSQVFGTPKGQMPSYEQALAIHEWMLRNGGKIPTAKDLARSVAEGLGGK